MKMMGLDWGEKRIGVAISDALGIIAQPFTVIEETDYSIRIDKLREIIKENDVREIIMGIALNLKGESGESAKKTEELAGKLSQELNIPVHLQDERFTTKEAERLLISFDFSRKKRKKTRDKLAAQMILQTFLDKKKCRHDD